MITHFNNVPNSTSARKIVLSLMGTSHKGYIDVESSVIQTQFSNEDEGEKEQKQTNVEDKLPTVKKLEEEINVLNKKIEKNSDILDKIESYIVYLNKLKEENVIEQSKTEPLYKIFEDWLLQRVIIHVNGCDIQGVLTEISHEYIKLVESEHIVVIPINKIDFIKLPL